MSVAAFKAVELLLKWLVGSIPTSSAKRPSDNIIGKTKIWTKEKYWLTKVKRRRHMQVDDSEKERFCRAALGEKATDRLIKAMFPGIYSKLRHGVALTDDELFTVVDIATDSFQNESPDVQTYEGHGGYGPFNITIRGVEGLYFVQAPEFDDSPLLYSIEEAREYIDEHYFHYLHES